jgi:hypothetical protein
VSTVRERSYILDARFFVGYFAWLVYSVAWGRLASRGMSWSGEFMTSFHSRRLAIPMCSLCVGTSDANRHRAPTSESRHSAISTCSTWAMRALEGNDVCRPDRSLASLIDLTTRTEIATCNRAAVGMRRTELLDAESHRHLDPTRECPTSG